MIEFIRKRDGRLVPFEEDKIATAIKKAVRAVDGTDMDKAVQIAREVVGILEVIYKHGRVPTVENVQDLVEKILIEKGHAKTAKAYILYRKQRETLRQTRPSTPISPRRTGGSTRTPTWVIRCRGSTTMSLPISPANTGSTRSIRSRSPTPTAMPIFTSTISAPWRSIAAAGTSRTCC
jgi:hypothetical protein